MLKRWVLITVGMAVAGGIFAWPGEAGNAYGKCGICYDCPPPPPPPPPPETPPPPPPPSREETVKLIRRKEEKLRRDRETIERHHDYYREREKRLREKHKNERPVTHDTADDYVPPKRFERPDPSDLDTGYLQDNRAHGRRRKLTGMQEAWAAASAEEKPLLIFVNSHKTAAARKKTQRMREHFQALAPLARNFAFVEVNWDQERSLLRKYDLQGDNPLFVLMVNHKDKVYYEGNGYKSRQTLEKKMRAALRSHARALAGRAADHDYREALKTAEAYFKSGDYGRAYAEYGELARTATGGLIYYRFVAQNRRLELEKMTDRTLKDIERALVSGAPLLATGANWLWPDNGQAARGEGGDRRGPLAAGFRDAGRAQPPARTTPGHRPGAGHLRLALLVCAQPRRSRPTGPEPRAGERRQEAFHP